MIDYLQIAKKVFQVEALTIQNLVHQLTDDFASFVEKVLKSNGKLVVSGMGKSGLIGQKIAATLASTGTPSFFIHPAEAYHGDLGMIESKDIVLLISNSGETNEVLRLIAYLKDNGNIVCAMTGNPTSILAKHSSFHLNVHVDQEACPLELAPTSSTTATLAMGDALAVALMEGRGFKQEQFARFHPGGALGKKLLMTVSDCMRSTGLPFVSEEITPQELVIKISEGRVGMVIVGNSNSVKGVITDGDLRRALAKSNVFEELQVVDIMSRTPVTVYEDQKLSMVDQLMIDKKITTILVKSRNNDHIVGIYQLYDK